MAPLIATGRTPKSLPKLRKAALEAVLEPAEAVLEPVPEAVPLPLAGLVAVDAGADETVAGVATREECKIRINTKTEP